MRAETAFLVGAEGRLLLHREPLSVVLVGRDGSEVAAAGPAPVQGRVPEVPVVMVLGLTGLSTPVEPGQQEQMRTVPVAEEQVSPEMGQAQPALPVAREDWAAAVAAVHPREQATALLVATALFISAIEVILWQQTSI